MTVQDGVAEHADQDEQVVRGAAGMPEPPAAPAAGEAPEIDDVEEAMRDVVDPELGINVVDLGLVYGIAVGLISSGETAHRIGGNAMTFDDEVRKLRLVVDVARDVWGST